MDTCFDPILYLQDTLGKELQQFAINTSKTFAGLRVKRKPNKDGDLHIPAIARHMEEHKVDFSSISDKITSSSTLGKYITNINFSSNGQLNLCLNRVAVTKSAICNVMSKGIEYGKISSNSCNNSYILSGYINYYDSQELTSLDYLRIIITIGHVKSLLSANGKSAEIIPLPLPKDDSLHDDLALFNDAVMKRTELDTEYQVLVKQTENTLQKNQFVTHGAAKNSSSEASDQTSEHHMCFDCQMYRKDSYFGQVNITQLLIHKLSSLELAARHTKGQSPIILHLTSQRKLHSSQQHGLVWEALSQKPLSQAYLSLGNVTAHSNQQPQQLSVNDLIRIREKQVRSAYLLKYGNIVDGAGWDDSIKSVAVSTLKLQIMAASQNSQVKIDVSDKSQDFRQATFIMYNCARLAKLFHHYEESVQQGHYPPLPQIDEVDFSLLREKDEWKLLVCYVMQYPAVVRDALNDLLSPTHDSIVTVNINKMCCFLLDLCKDFSSYYGRTHVLGEPRPHLFPSMFARLYLLKAIQQVFHNCLALMDIQPLTQM